MDPVAQVLAQQNSGLVDGQGFGQFAVQGMQLGQNQQQINLSRRRLELEEQQQQERSLLLPLEAEYARLRNEQTGIAVQSDLMKLKQQTAAMNKMPELVALQEEFLSAPDGYSNKELVNRAFGLAKQAPWLFETDTGKQVMGNILLMPKLEQAQRMLQSFKPPEGTALQSYDPATGRMTLMQEPRQANQPAALQEAAAVTNLRRRIASETDPQKKADLELELSDLLTQTQPAGTVTEVFDPNTGNPIMRTSTGRRSESGGMTTATATEIQKKSLATDQALSKLNEAITAIQENPDAIGVRGAVGEISEKVKGQLSPSSEGSTRITDTRHKAGMAFVEIAKSLRVDSGNMSRYELSQIEDLGDLRNLSESAQTALSKADNLRNALIGQKLRYLRAESKRPDDAFLRQIPGPEIGALVSENLLSVEDAMRARKLQIQK